MPTTKIRMKWMKENIYTDRCEELATIVERYTDYLNTIKEGFINSFSYKAHEKERNGE